MKIEQKSVCNLLDCDGSDATFTVRREDGTFTVTVRGNPGSILPSLVIRRLNTLQVKQLATAIVEQL